MALNKSRIISRNARQCDKVMKKQFVMLLSTLINTIMKSRLSEENCAKKSQKVFGKNGNLQSYFRLRNLSQVRAIRKSLRLTAGNIFLLPFSPFNCCMRWNVECHKVDESVEHMNGKNCLITHNLCALAWLVVLNTLNRELNEQFYSILLSLVIPVSEWTKRPHQHAACASLQLLHLIVSISRLPTTSCFHT